MVLAAIGCFLDVALDIRLVVFNLGIAAKLGPRFIRKIAGSKRRHQYRTERHRDQHGHEVVKNSRGADQSQLGRIADRCHTDDDADEDERDDEQEQRADEDQIASLFGPVRIGIVAHRPEQHELSVHTTSGQADQDQNGQQVPVLHGRKGYRQRPSFAGRARATWPRWRGSAV